MVKHFSLADVLFLGG